MNLGSLPELDRLERLLDEHSHPLLQVDILHRERHAGRDFPLHLVTLGTPDPEAPTFFLMGGLHGLERIGSDVVIAYLQNLLSRLRWDESFLHLLGRMRIVMLPIFNPVGMLQERRANSRGVDLMRNAPVESPVPALATAFYRGQVLSPRLPYYRGTGLEPEIVALLDYCRRDLFKADPLLTLDLHSGFGARDQIWFPFAHTRKIFPRVPEIMALSSILDEAQPHHRYVVEPQCLHYTAHGDLWDFLYREHGRSHADQTFIPLTLELSSWGWIRKNPRQFTSALGLFHPIKPHRISRALRQHIGLLDFMCRITAASGAWAQVEPAGRHALLHAAGRKWPILEL